MKKVFIIAFGILCGWLLIKFFPAILILLGASVSALNIKELVGFALIVAVILLVVWLINRLKNEDKEN